MDAQASPANSSPRDHAPVHQGDAVRQSSVRQTQWPALRDNLPEAAFDAARRQRMPGCLPGTRRWELEEIRDWADVDDANSRDSYWLKGMEGTGKTTVALTVTRGWHDQGRLAASFFFAHGGGDLATMRCVPATIAAQLQETVPGLREEVALAVGAHPDIHTRDVREQWSRLVLEPLRAAVRRGAVRDKMILVFDGLDALGAIDAGHRQSDAELLVQCLAEAVAVTRAKLRVFVATRSMRWTDHPSPGHSQAYGFGCLDDGEAAHHGIDPDLARYYEHALRPIQEYLCPGASKQVSPRLFSQLPNGIYPIGGAPAGVSQLLLDNAYCLAERSAGIFVYAAVACRFFREDPALASKRIAALLEEFARIKKRLPQRQPYLEAIRQVQDRLYTTILQSVFKPWKKRELLPTLAVIAALFDSLPLDSLAVMLGEGTTTADLRRRLAGLHLFLTVPERDDEPVRLLRTFREFLLDKSRCLDRRYSINAQDTHSRLFTCCLQVMSAHLHANMCSFPHPGARSSDVSPADVAKIPLAVRYACQYWVYHLMKSSNPRQKSADVVGFFRRHFLDWLEVLALVGRLGDAIGTCAMLETILPAAHKPAWPRQHHGLPQAMNIIYDARRFILRHRPMIERAPLQVHYSALVFSPETSIIREFYREQLPAWIRRLPALSDTWGIHVHTLAHPAPVRCVAFSDNGRDVLSGSDDAKARIWDVTTGAPKRVLAGAMDPISAICATDIPRVADRTNHRDIVAWCSSKREIKWYDVRSGRRSDFYFQTILRGYAEGVIAFSPDGRYVASTSSKSDTIEVDDRIYTGWREFEGHANAVCAVAFSAENRQMVSGSRDQTVRVWDTKTCSMIISHREHSRAVLAVAFSLDGRLVLSGSEDKTSLVWDTKTQCKGHWFAGHTDSVCAVVFSADDRQVVSGSADHTVRVWDVARGHQEHVLEGHTDSVTAVAISRDGCTIISSSADETVRVWDIRAGFQQHVVRHPSSVVYTVAASFDGRKIASGSTDGALQTYDAATEFRPRVLANDAIGPVHAIAFSPNGQKMATCSMIRPLEVWALPENEGPHALSLSGLASAVRSVAFSPDGRRVVSSFIDETIRVYDAATRAQQHVFDGFSELVYAVAFSPDGQLVVSGSHDGHIRVRDAAGPQKYVLEGQPDIVCVAFSPDGRRIVSGSNDGTLIVWDTATGLQEQLLHVGIGVRYVRFLPCGDHLATNYGVLELDSSSCQSCRRIFKKESWITVDGIDLLCVPPEYEETFLCILGNKIFFQVSPDSPLQILELDLTASVEI